MQFAGLVAVYVLVSAVGLYKIKAAEGVNDAALWLGAVAYGTGFVIWLLILRRFPLSFAFPVAAGSLIMATQAIGYAFLREPMSAEHLVGVTLIIAGIALVFARS